MATHSAGRTLLAASLALAACGGESTAIKILDATSEAYVLLDPASLDSGGPASPDEVGMVPARGLDESLVFVYREQPADGRSLRVLVVYTAAGLIPRGSVYLTLTPNQALELARDDAEAEGVLVNPDSPASSGWIPKDHLGSALGRLSPRRPLPKSLSVVE